MKPKKYLNDFKLKDDDITYEYQGDIYVLKGDKSQITKKLILIMLSLSVLVIVNGIIPFEGMSGYVYIIMPYLIEVLMMGLFDYAMIVFTKYVDELRAYRYESSIKNGKVYLLIILILAISSMLSTIIFVIKHDISIYGIIYCIVNAFIILVVKISMDIVNELQFDITKNPNK